MKVMLIDDSKTMRNIQRNILAQAGHTEIEEACDGQDALSKVTAFAPELLLVDWNMPNMTGIELLRAVRADAALCKLPVLMITAEAKKENIIEAAQAKANGYIVKPFTAAVLDEKLNKILKTMEKV